jgi:protein-tyrosine phosphatase
MIDITSPTRWLPIEGAFNVRDLGGYALERGATRWRSLLRADSLHRLTDADQQMLIDYGVRTVIDLRHASETTTAPNVFAASTVVSYRSIPLFRAAPPAANGSAMPPDLATIYRYMLDGCRAGLGEALAAIADADDGAVLFHCTAGKDRTGVVSALLLGIAGVAPDVIIHDYTLTAQAMARMRPYILAQAEGAGGKTQDVERLLGSDAPDMQYLLDYLATQYDGAAAYGRSVGLSERQIDQLRARLVHSELID